MSKWTSAAGPRQTKRINGLLRKFSWEANTYIEITGIQGEEGTRTTLTDLFSVDGPKTPEALEYLKEVSERFEYKLTRENVKEVEAALGEALKKAIAARAVIDKREPREKVEERDRVYEESQAKDKARREDIEKRRAEIIAKRPSWARSAIVAQLVKDTSDIMSDYFAHTIERDVVIGWHTSPRNDFKAMRAAARNFEPTAHLADGPKEFEHRDNYSMGHGLYLKKDYIHNSGWMVSQYGPELQHLYHIEDGLPGHKGQGETVEQQSGECPVEVRENSQRGGVELHFAAKPEPDTLAKLKGSGWRWAFKRRCWYKRARPGVLEEAEKLAQEIA